MTLSPSLVPTIPFSDPVLIVALATVIFLVVPLLFEKLRVPGIIGLIVAGAAVGPHGFGLLLRDPTIILLGTVGLLYLMLMVGLELDLNEFNRYRNRSIVFGALSFAIPAAAGLAVGLGLGYSLLSALLVASAFASHTLLAFPIASRLGIVRNEAVTTALGGTILTDIMALLLLAVVANSAESGMSLGFWVRLAVPFIIYVAVVLWALPRLGRWFFRRVGEGGAEFVFVLASLFTVSYLAHSAGVEPIIGALLTGLALNRLIPAQGALMNRIHFVGNAVFIPFFLLSVGMLVNVRALTTAKAWTIAVALTAGVVVSKWLATWIAAKIFGYSGDEGWTMFGLSAPHAAGTLAIVLVGFEIGLLDETEVNGVVLMILVTCLAGPWAVARFGARVAERERARPYDADAAPRRILIPLANPKRAEGLMELAFAIRGGDSDEPLLPLTVAPEEGYATEAWVAEAEQMLSHAVHLAASAGVRAVPVTRVDGSVADGIVRGIAETRSTTVVIGWDGRRSGAFAIFGTVLDRLLEQTRQMMVVARLSHPLKLTSRLTVIVPPGLERHPGLAEALGVVHRIASDVGGSLSLLTVQAAPEPLVEAQRAARPAMSAEWRVADDWPSLLASLRESTRADDLTVLVSARRGGPAWHPRLRHLPEQVAESVSADFVALYPPDAVPTADAPGAAVNALAPDRVVDLETADYTQAYARMLASVLEPADARELAGTLVDAERRMTTEIRPGIALPHARIGGLPQPRVVLGVSRAGIRLPRAAHPVRLFVLLLSPEDHPEQHLRALAGIAQVIADPAVTAELLERYAPAHPLDWLRVAD
ncbi:cation:proton antiporter [Longimicrobium terrae]|uniref:Kef-type K+ transport system membrane component KefB/mannitol/fructose-specific phosphotransferase system IIA component (Ntr-type) n=1 Tax=Longimicrobium terrae TaxID=1639882 RepID=A0A841H3G3_9BACT|nr:cation:proton antiporter [Longimicrobium terrae]MBB4637775.1 Kef-type K+ transport system membrane component KefB/mannitol/fructose-specific phosphotransferase system IIA component (Ntr-type) [Longimicrobium terrae]MBB6072369.1 Kef-type K+ transport system membrane component KefB/mannitol/fructose-specific phosphotransferase system IIA component (Ntr-type) [Longimicrobium terrae]NNC31287.1 PTS transporter subunit EIIA [Longimicrobium terrae]